MTDKLILAIDEGTTSTRAIAFDLSGRIVATAGRPLTQSYPQPGWVEHDAAEIWASTDACVREVLGQVGIESVAAIGVTNQRETVVFWSAATGEPLAPAIVWQDRRTADECAALRSAGHEAAVQAATGLLLDPYFSGTKMAWAMREWPAVKAACEARDLRVGTVDSWLAWKLTEGHAHISDATNASRTLLMDLAHRRWSDELLALLHVPAFVLPHIVPCAGRLAETNLYGRPLPIAGMAGDQQAASIGQACLLAGQVKCTYGTGIFMLAHAGDAPPVSRNRLLATLAADTPKGATFALEGSIFVGGDAVKWLRDGLGVLNTAAESEALAASVPDSGGVTFVPAFAGLGAPHWQPRARGLLTGITGGTTRAHIVRATLEAMSQQTADLLEAMARDGVTPAALKVDGGMVANNWLCQDLADATGLVVERPRVIETTAMGAAMLAAVGVGLFTDLDAAAAAMVGPDARFEPRTTPAERAHRRECWHRAIAQTLGGIS